MFGLACLQATTFVFTKIRNVKSFEFNLFVIWNVCNLKTDGFTVWPPKTVPGTMLEADPGDVH